ncbi:MAG: NAD(P)H-hydrate dehydratase [Gammaproteobacteria bacterium]|nr:NAD(P)H-hydrate dehydratase [Gammaproteobacteria bacterium]
MSEAATGIWPPEAVRILDRTATSAFGISGYELMGRAAEAVCAAASARWPDARRWLILCGAGNNGGDGYVIARLARRAGREVQVCALTDPAFLPGDAATAWRDFVADGGTVVPFAPGLPSSAGLVVDAILGTGLARPVTGELRAAIEAVNAAQRPVVAVDIPSGLDATTGLPSGVAIRADLTVTFVGRKLGLHLGEGPAHAGVVEFSALGIPSAVVERAGLAGQAPLRLFTATELPRILPRRTATAHKGNFGHVLVVGGNHGMSGAVRLAGEAALRAGAGLVSVATRPAHAPLLPLVRPELMCHAIGGAAELAPLLVRATVVALGPGLGQDDWARDLLAATLSCGLPLVVDADALNLLTAAHPSRDDWILTPHPGEAARLLGVTTVQVQRDRLGALRSLRERWGGTIVLKGSGTLVAGSTGPGWAIPTGNPGMATAGMGDVLTGITAGLVAQAGAGIGRADVAAAAAYVHGAAGDAAARGGQRGILASDLIGQLRPWLNP